MPPITDAAADALMGLLGATLASGRVTIAPRRGPLHIRFTFGDRTLDLVQAGGYRDLQSEPGKWLERASSRTGVLRIPSPTRHQSRPTSTRR
jgi:hypothetical protein